MKELNNLTDTEQEIIDVLLKFIDTENLSSPLSLKSKLVEDLGLDSLDLTTLLIEINLRFDIDFSQEEIILLQKGSVAYLIKEINKKTSQTELNLN